MTDLTDRTEDTISRSVSPGKKGRGRPSKSKEGADEKEDEGKSPPVHVRKNKKGKEERKRDRTSKKTQGTDDVEMKDEEITVDYAVTKFYQTSFFGDEQPKEDVEEIKQKINDTSETSDESV